MGQRLVIVNRINSEDINAIYYHWSAYTDSALHEVAKLAERVSTFMKQDMSDKSLTDKFNLACLASISGISESSKDSRDYIEKLTGVKYEDNRIDRSYGLIGYTEQDREDLLSWSEGTLTIDWVFENDIPDLVDSTFDLWSLTYSDTLEDYIEYNHDENIDELTDEEIESYKPETHDINLESLMLEAAESYMDLIPDEWYDANDDLVRYKIA